MMNNRVNKFSDQMAEQDKGRASMMVGRSLSKYSNISKISMNQTAGPSRELMQRTCNVRAFSNDAVREHYDKAGIEAPRMPGISQGGGQLFGGIS